MTDKILLGLMRLLWLPVSVAITLAVMLKGWGMRPESWTVIVFGYTLQAIVAVGLTALEVRCAAAEKK